VYRALLLTGVAGVGKSTVADAVGRVLTTAGFSSASSLSRSSWMPGRKGRAYGLGDSSLWLPSWLILDG
jgi:adenylate kinase family enzyme